MSISHVLLIHHGRPCPYCGVTMRVRKSTRRVKTTRQPDFPTRDHVIPKSVMPAQGTLVACHKCNQDKAARTLDQWLAHLRETDDARAEIVHAFMRDNRHLMSPVIARCEAAE